MELWRAHGLPVEPQPGRQDLLRGGAGHAACAAPPGALPCPAHGPCGVPAPPSARFAGRDWGREGKPKQQGQTQGENLGSVAPHAPPASPEGGRWHGPAGIRGDNFPFLKNFTGIAGVRGQQLQFQRAASAGWAGEQVEGSILGAPQAGHPAGLQAGTPSPQGSCPLPWPPPPRGRPPAHQQEPSPSPDSSYPPARSHVTQLHTRVHQTLGAMGQVVLCDLPGSLLWAGGRGVGRWGFRGTVPKQTEGGTGRWQEEMGERAARILLSPSQCQRKRKALSSLILALIIAGRIPAGGNYQPRSLHTQLQLFWWLHGAQQHVLPGRQPTPGRQQQWHQARQGVLSTPSPWPGGVPLPPSQALAPRHLLLSHLEDRTVPISSHPAAACAPSIPTGTAWACMLPSHAKGSAGSPRGRRVPHPVFLSRSGPDPISPARGRKETSSPMPGAPPGRAVTPLSPARPLLLQAAPLRGVQRRFLWELGVFHPLSPGHVVSVTGGAMRASA